MGFGAGGRGDNQLLHSPVIVIQQECACPYLVRAPLWPQGPWVCVICTPSCHTGSSFSRPTPTGPSVWMPVNANWSWRGQVWHPTQCTGCIFNSRLHCRGITEWGNHCQEQMCHVSTAGVTTDFNLTVRNTQEWLLQLYKNAPLRKSTEVFLTKCT